MAEKGFKMNENIEEDKDIKTTQDKGSVLKRLVIPQADIDKVEEARKALHVLLKDKLSNGVYAELCFEVTAPIYKLTHKKYDKVV